MYLPILMVILLTAKGGAMSRATRYSFSILVFLLMTVSSNGSKADNTLSIKENKPSFYTVVKGDTLWGISGMYLENPEMWSYLWQVNPDVTNPNLIHPGDKLHLSWRYGQPNLKAKPTVKLSPRVRVIKRQPTPVIDEGIVLPYLESLLLLNKNKVAKSSRVLGTSSGLKLLSQQALLYVSGHQTHKAWGLYRIVNEFSRDEQVMVAVKKIASATLAISDEEFSGLVVDDQRQEILVDDIALPFVEEQQEVVDIALTPKPAPFGLETHILGAFDDVHFAANGQVVVIDRGRDDGLTKGSHFSLFNQGAKVIAKSSASEHLQLAIQNKIILPDSRVGHLMVIQAYESISLAVVMGSISQVSKETQLQASTAAEIKALSNFNSAESKRP